MDVERTIEYILQIQAKAEERMAKAEARMARAEERMDKFDRRLEAIGKLVQTGMKMLVRIERKHDALAEQVSALTEAQRQSERKFDRLMALWSKRPPNGHRPK